MLVEKEACTSQQIQEWVSLHAHMLHLILAQEQQQKRYFEKVGGKAFTAIDNWV